MAKFETHVYAVVRVKVLGTNFSDNPQEIAEKISDAVCASPREWFRPIHGTVHVPEVGSFDIDCVESAEGIYGVLVDEIDPDTGYVLASHDFDDACEPRGAEASLEESSATENR